MTSFVALLRGVNVGGIKVPMADLRELAAGLGLDDVRTVLASGNLLFTHDGADAVELRRMLEEALTERFSYAATVFVLPRDTLAAQAAAYPYRPREGWHDYLMIVDDAEVLAELVAVPTAAGEQTAAGDGCLYWQVERGLTLTSPVGKASGVRRVAQHVTNRNLNTIRKLV
ncbi:MAG: DUF1697 domain-containing protein [Nocardioides sp.]|uniref:DUF1697 domain-containing protein n=1 Tax=Nocardioides sp. TaxID=35761 RepID=UPI0039E2475A